MGARGSCGEGWGGVVNTIADVLEGRATWAYGNCDGFALASWLGESAVDHVIGDPPYDEQTHVGARTLKWTEDKTNPKAKWAASGGAAVAIDFASLPPIETFVGGLATCSKRWVILFCSLEMLGDYRAASGESWVRSGTWNRKDPAPQISGDRPGQGSEGIAIMHRKGRKRWNGGGRQATWTGPTCKDPRRMHPTKKPLWLMEALIRDFTDPGDLVFDPTGGEGTTGEACVKLGRRFIGCELDPKYHAAGLARIARAANGLKQVEMFA